MTAVPPSLPRAGIPVATPPAAANLVTVVAPPPSSQAAAKLAAQLAALPAAAVLDATVIAVEPAAGASAAPGSIVQLATAVGPLVVKLPMPVPPGTAVQLLLAAAGEGPQLRLLAVDGRPLTAGATPPGQAAGAVAVSDQPSGSGEIVDSAPPPAPPSAGIVATLVHAEDNDLPTGMTFPVRIASLAPPAPPAVPPSSAPSSSPAAASSSAPSAAPAVFAAASATVSSTSSLAPAIAAEPASSGDGMPTATTTAPIASPALTTPAATGSPAESAMPLPPSNWLPPASASDSSAGRESGPTAASDQAAGPSMAAPAPAMAGSPPAPDIPASAPSLSGGTPALPDAALSMPDTAAGAPANLPPQLSGTVTLNTADGQPLVQTSIGLLALDADPQELPPGTHVSLVVAGPPQPLTPHAAAGPLPSAPAGGTAPGGSPASGGGWVALDDAVAALRQSDPASAQRLLQHLPTPGPRLAATLLELVVAARSGSLQAWLDEAVIRALERAGQHDVLAALEHDFAGLRSAGAGPAGSDWQAMWLPLLWGQRTERIRLATRRPPRDDAEAAARDEDGARFLVDVELSRLGPLQLDGLAKRRSRRLDLIVRSRSPLPGPARADIGRIFSATLDGFGMSGGVSFQTGGRFVQAAPFTGGDAGIFFA